MLLKSGIRKVKIVNYWSWLDELKSWIHKNEFVNTSFLYFENMKSWIWNHECIKLNSWIYKIEIVRSWSWNRELLKIKSWIYNVGFMKSKSWIHEAEIVNTWIPYFKITNSRRYPNRPFIPAIFVLCVTHKRSGISNSF
jgi:hypothetical protein